MIVSTFRRWTPAVIWAAVTALLLAGCGASGIDDATGEAATEADELVAAAEDDPRWQAIAAMAPAFVAERPGGAVVHVVRDGEYWTAAVGDADAAGEPLRSAAPFRVGSLTKAFVATLVLQLVDEGVIGLDDPLGSHVPEVSLGQDTTVRELLGHRSGLANYTDQGSFLAEVRADRERMWSPQDMLEYAATDDPRPPGERFRYSNTNYVLLGLLIEAADGTDLQSSLDRRIVEPLDLADTRFVLDDDIPDALPAGWSPRVLEGERGEPYTSISSSAWAAGALVSSGPDLLMFLRALFDGRLLSDESLAEMTDTSEDGYGFGLSSVGLGDAGSGYTHAGAISGYTASMNVTADGGDVIVVLTNNDALMAEALARAIAQQW